MVGELGLLVCGGVVLFYSVPPPFLRRWYVCVGPRCPSPGAGVFFVGGVLWAGAGGGGGGHRPPMPPPVSASVLAGMQPAWADLQDNKYESKRDR